MTRILVVEDEAIVATDLQRTLRRLGYDVPEPVSSAAEALAYAERQGVDLVLMDIHIKGGLDGIEAARLLRERFQIPVVYLTAYADDETLQRAKATVPSGYLVKPFAEDTLRTTVMMAMHREDTARVGTRVVLVMAEVMQKLPQAVVVVDDQRNAFFSNAAATQLLGQECTGQPVAALFEAGEDLRRLLTPTSKGMVQLTASANGRRLQAIPMPLETPKDSLLLVLSPPGAEIRTAHAEAARQALQRRLADLV